jgi:exodeoxyribonuclease V gamma subunit
VLSLVYSNATDRLLDALRAAPRAELPFDPVDVIVPNRHVGLLAKLAVARRRGIVANLRTPLLSAFLAERCGDDERLLTAATLEGALLERLQDRALLAEPELAPVARYLGTTDPLEDERSEGATDRRRVQLAARLAALFEEYDATRPELGRGWSRGVRLFGEAAGRTEAWQQRLWHALFGPGGALRGQAPRWQTWWELLERWRQTPPPLPPRLWLLLPPAHVGALWQATVALLGALSDVTVLALNPCAEYWEDVATLRDERRARARGVELAVEHPLLRLWGRVGRDSTARLNALTDGDFEARFQEPMSEGGGAPPRLGLLQAALLSRAPTVTPGETPPCPGRDPSLRIVPCRELREELVRVAAAIRERVAREPSSRLDEIAVALPRRETERYVAHLVSVFRDHGELPLQLLDLPQAAPLLVIEAAERLLALPLGRATRPELLALLCHPAFGASRQGVDVERWARWCEALAIFRGADGEAHADSYWTGESFHWDQGLRRLTLGAFMAGEPSGAQVPFQAGAESWLPYELSPGQLEDGATFVRWTRALLNDLGRLRTARLCLRGWADELRRFITTYVTPPSEDEEAPYAAALSCLDTLVAMDVSAGAVRHSYGVAHELVRRQLATTRRSRAQIVGPGVVVGTLESLRGAPFAHLFLVGMNEGSFPSSEPRSPLDLRHEAVAPGGERPRGGTSPMEPSARDRDHYLFLETLANVRRSLWLSYVARDPVSGDERLASPVVEELRFLMGVEPEPLVPDPTAPEEGAAYDPKAATSAAVGPPVAAAGPRGATPGPPRMHATLTELRQLIDSPLELSARLHHELAPPERTEWLSQEDEPLEVTGWSERALLETLLAATLRSTEDVTRWRTPEGWLRQLVSLYEEVTQRGRLRGVLPAGPFGESIRRRHHEALGHLAAAAAALFGQGTAPWGPLQLGRGARIRQGELDRGVRLTAMAARPVAVARLVLPELELELIGTTGQLLRTASGNYGTLRLEGSPEGAPESGERGALLRLKRLLAPFFDHVVLAATGAAALEPHDTQLWTLQAGRLATSRVAFAPLTQAEALDYLTGLTTELLAPSDGLFVPVEAALLRHLRGDALSFADAVSAVLAGEIPLVRVEHAAIPFVERYAPTPAHEELLSRRVHQRLGLFFRLLPDPLTVPRGEGSKGAP